MKKLIFSLAITALVIASYSQAPTAFNYQAILRNSDGTIKADENVSIQIDIVNEMGISSYMEIHNMQTSEFGLVNLVVGEGTTSDDLSTVDWTKGPYFIDITVNGANMGSSPLLSVPYALHSNTADSLIGGTAESDPLYRSSVAFGISESDTSSWNNKLDSYTETQNLSDVLTINNNGNGNQIKNVGDPTDNQDAVTKSYATLRVSLEGDSLFMGSDQWVIIPGISDANDTVNYVLDSDNNRYRIITIGSQVWMGSNLMTTKYKNGDEIIIAESDAQWSNLSSPAFCWYDNDQVSAPEHPYGPLYNWYAVETGNLCPDGWHIPNHGEWMVLSDYTGGIPISAGALKEDGFDHWSDPNTGATDDWNFKALPGGYRITAGEFRSKGKPVNESGNIAGYWWTSSEGEVGKAKNIIMFYNSSMLYSEYTFDKEFGMSVRCVKD